MDDGKVILGFDPGDPEGRLTMAVQDDSGTLQLADTHYRPKGLYSWVDQDKDDLVCEKHGVVSDSVEFHNFPAQLRMIADYHTRLYHPRKYYQYYNVVRGRSME